MILARVAEYMPDRVKQHWDPDRYRRNAGFVAKLGLPLVELLNPCAGERVLDLGCGDGALTAKLRDMGMEVVGVDSSPDQVRAAQELGLDAHVMSGEALRFVSEFDAVFSNAAMHWMTDADAVISGVWRALRPGGRFVSEMGGTGNVAKIRDALNLALGVCGYDGQSADPWYFPTADEQRGRLEQCGFVVTDITLFDRPTPLPGDVGDWLETFAESYIGMLPDGLRQRVVADVVERLYPVLLDETGTYIADYVRLRFHAVRES
jgi:SAM-dependent methyltransferase